MKIEASPLAETSTSKVYKTSYPISHYSYMRLRKEKRLHKNYGAQSVKDRAILKITVQYL